MKLVTPKAAAKHELLFNKPTSELWLFAPAKPSVATQVRDARFKALVCFQNLNLIFASINKTQHLDHFISKISLYMKSLNSFNI